MTGEMMPSSRAIVVVAGIWLLSFAVSTVAAALTPTTEGPPALEASATTGITTGSDGQPRFIVDVTVESEVSFAEADGTTTKVYGRIYLYKNGESVEGSVDFSGGHFATHREFGCEDAGAMVSWSVHAWWYTYYSTDRSGESERGGSIKVPLDLCGVITPTSSTTTSTPNSTSTPSANSDPVLTRSSRAAAMGAMDQRRYYRAMRCRARGKVVNGGAKTWRCRGGWAQEQFKYCQATYRVRYYRNVTTTGGFWKIKRVTKTRCRPSLIAD